MSDFSNPDAAPAAISEAPEPEFPAWPAAFLPPSLQEPCS